MSLLAHSIIHELIFSFLNVVNSRLLSVEKDVRQLKSQLAALSANAVAAPCLDSRLSVQTSSERLEQPETQVSGGPEQEKLSDPTDGVGTIEFSDKESWAYFGERPPYIHPRFEDLTTNSMLQVPHRTLHLHEQSDEP
jgi:hypothetical protein